VEIVDSHADLNVYKQGGAAACCGPAPSCCGPADDSPAGESGFHDRMSRLLETFDANEYAASVKIFALKPV